MKCDIHYHILCPTFNINTYTVITPNDIVYFVYFYCIHILYLCISLYLSPQLKKKKTTAEIIYTMFDSRKHRTHRTGDRTGDQFNIF